MKVRIRMVTVVVMVVMVTMTTMMMVMVMVMVIVMVMVVMVMVMVVVVVGVVVVVVVVGFDAGLCECTRVRVGFVPRMTSSRHASPTIRTPRSSILVPLRPSSLNFGHASARPSTGWGQG